MSFSEQGNGQRPSLSLDGKVALVTGGSRGIGAATVRLLRQTGARVIFSYQKAADRAGPWSRSAAAKIIAGRFNRTSQRLKTVRHW